MTTSGAPTNSPSKRVCACFCHNATGTYTHRPSVACCENTGAPRSEPCGNWDPNAKHEFRVLLGYWVRCPGVTGPAAPAEPAPDVAVFYSVGYLDHAGRPRPLDLAKWTPDRRRAVAAVASFNSEYATAAPYFVIEQTITTSAVRRAI